MNRRESIAVLLALGAAGWVHAAGAQSSARVGVLANPANSSYATLAGKVRAVAGTQGLAVFLADARAPADIEGAIAAFARSGAGAFIVASDALFTQEMRRIAQLAARSRLAVIAPFSQYAEAGALLSYGVNFSEHFRRTAFYIDRILKGAKPGDLPVERPTNFEFVANLGTARAIGIKLPNELLLRADRVIE